MRKKLFVAAILTTLLRRLPFCLPRRLNVITARVAMVAAATE